MMNKKKFSSLLLTGSLLIGMSTAAFAEENVSTIIGAGTEENPATVSITKNFEMAEGLNVPEVNFKFTATSTTTGAPVATISSIVYDGQEDKLGTLTDGKYILTKNSEITFGKFPHAGEYLYTVTETQEKADGVTYSTDSYTLRVYVANGSNGGTYIQTITAEKGTSSGDISNKVDKILFTNIYRKNTSLEIEKVTTGDLADKTKDFDFTITLTKSVTETEETPSYTGEIGTETITVPAGKEITFKLHDGEKLVFNDLPAGTRYVVTEIGVNDGYTPSVQVTENGTQNTVKNGADANSLSSADNGNTNLVGENTNKVIFTNAYDNVPITGLIINNLPFILLIGVAVLALGTLAIIKRKRTLKI